MYDEKYQSNFPNSNYLSNLNNLNKTNQTIQLNRLPTLGEILANKSKSPVDLFTFYQFMQNVENKVDYLDFWFDLINHLNLCKHYVKGLRDSIIRQSSHFNNSSDIHNQQLSNPAAQQQFHQPHSQQQRNTTGSSSEFNRQSFFQSPNEIRNSNPVSEKSQKHKSLSSSILLDLIINDNILEENDSHRLSAFLRGDINLDNIDPKLKNLIEQYNSELDESNVKRTSSQSQLQSSHNILNKTPPLSSGQFNSSKNSLVRSSPSFLHSTNYKPPKNYQNQNQNEKRVSSNSGLFSDYDDSDIDQHPHSNDSLYENQLDIGQADRAISASNYVQLQQNSSSNILPQSPLASSSKQLQQQPQQPQQRNRESTINPSLLEKLIKDSPASTNNKSFITRENLKESSHNLLLKYFVEDSEKNLNLPSQLNSYIIKSIEIDGRDDPDIFNYVKNYIFNKLENDHLPKFLDFMATRNINHSNFLRILLGFFFLFIGFWIGFIFIFLNYRKGLRPVVIVPFLLSFYFIISSIYLVDPILAWFGISETFSKNNISGGKRSKGKLILKIKEPFIYKFILKRSLWVLFLILLFTAILTILFSLVPGHRL
ncbi:RAX1 [Candida pseudojiufengensis]|uniref:RAX1 n=1 Tax=Candida pseudojiufengensis TaxID=497109 RepID=UPI0022259797|nr:RAX1 [Candida pseudojiufengensis]KAI5967005.1 RAX1 [Candida pseudojiufengensis]